MYFSSIECYHYCDQNDHNMAYFRVISKNKHQEKDQFSVRSGSLNKSLVFLFEEINALKRKLKPDEIASSKKKKTDCLLSNEINLTISGDEDEFEEYFFLQNLVLSRLSWQKHLNQNLSTDLLVRLSMILGANYTP
jgi:hypothetical protein